MNLVIVRQGTGRYLFRCPEDITLNKGDMVLCKTRIGVQPGTLLFDSFHISEDDPVFEIIKTLIGAKATIAPVVAKTTTVYFAEDTNDD